MIILPELTHRKNGKQLIRVAYSDSGKEVQLTLRAGLLCVKTEHGWKKINFPTHRLLAKLLNHWAGVNFVKIEPHVDLF